ncbi:unnamed protein product [Linum tenue]|uniref:SP-RING-type domain-containing protein n=1 Tax=Linum tenue TaxID=586396 RepID=A0AAV0K1F6_9ROSI|nr:unnamed protein product [Linum tenue]
MAGKVAQPLVPPATGLTVGEESTLSASLVNSFRVIAVVDRLALHLQPGRENNSSEFFGLCLSLARGIDYAVANNELPSKVQDLPLLLKQVCRRKNDPLLEAAIMVLMISVKNACKVGWFSDRETQELISLSSEIGNSFRSFGDTLDASGSPHSTVSTVLSRYYPKMKMGDILVSLEVKPGFGAYVQDFHISKKSNHSPHEKIRLFVAQTDGMDTSACIISPQQVNFLLNGKGVDRRTNIQLDTGPQLPTNVTGMLKYGTNLLQAVGTFHGNYVIIVAFMSTVQLPDPPVLLDYVQSSSTLSDPDSDIIEGPSRISLNCPISFSRIKTPIKGSSCKHLQCFDFGNYVEINSKRPSWRCPHCNQNVSYADIRVDQNIFKVLKEVGENITHVNISADGSWKAVMETDDNGPQAPPRQRETPEQPESSNAESPATPMILDLTEGDDLMDELLSNCDTEEHKPSPASFLGQTLPHLDDHSTSQMGDWANAFFPATTITSPVIMDTSSTVLNMDSSAQLAPLATENNTGMRYVGVPANRVPTAIQALPATFMQHQTPRMNNSINNVNSTGGLSSVNSSLPPSASASGYTNDMFQRFSRSQTALPHVSGLASAMLRQTPLQSLFAEREPSSKVRQQSKSSSSCWFNLWFAPRWSESIILTHVSSPSSCWFNLWFNPRCSKSIIITHTSSDAFTRKSSHDCPDSISFITSFNFPSGSSQQLCSTTTSQAGVGGFPAASSSITPYDTY